MASLPVAVVAAQVHIGGVPQQQARDEEDGALVVQGPGGRLLRVVGVEQRVQPAQGAAAVVGAAGHLVPEEELARLLKRLGLCVRDLAVERAQVAQVRGDLRVRNARRQLRRDAGIGVNAAGEGGRLPVAEHALVVGDVHDVLGHIARLVPLARGSDSHRAGPPREGARRINAKFLRNKKENRTKFGPVLPHRERFFYSAVR